MKKVLALDLMGVVYTEGHIILNALYPLLKKKKHDIDYETLKKHYIVYGAGKMDRKTFWKNIGFSNVPKNIEHQFLASFKLEKDFMKNIKKLKKDYKIVGLSNNPREWGRYLKEKNNLDKIFSCVLISGNCKLKKPDKRIYKELIKRVGGKPQDYYFVDDKLRNLRPAKQVGMKTVWFKRNKADTIFKPDFTIRSFNDLRRFL